MSPVPGHLTRDISVRCEDDRQDGDQFDHTKGYPGEGHTKPWKDIRLATTNITSHGSLGKLVLAEADIWVIQEHHLIKPDDIRKLRTTLLNLTLLSGHCKKYQRNIRRSMLCVDTLAGCMRRTHHLSLIHI